MGGCEKDGNIMNSIFDCKRQECGRGAEGEESVSGSFQSVLHTARWAKAIVN